ncbi:hypothetical protein FN846DRAFT_204549 [Sphaerosporella brunnea]|uniref:LYR motif-containing protein 2 n=1 Tax=Sphaerosporella brunnea TaxID=1250544 RepID=A0A5J5F897_9PEZI|nr:hypothetical protein FN846DRAFT_204549 [Sphaerosporella brunnea]
MRELSGRGSGLVAELLSNGAGRTEAFDSTTAALARGEGKTVLSYPPSQARGKPKPTHTLAGWLAGCRATPKLSRQQSAQLVWTGDTETERATTPPPTHSAMSPQIPAQIPSLQSFILRQRVLGLWRDILRASAHSPNKSELRQWARSEFERNRDVKDPSHVRYLLSTGKTEFQAVMGRK